MRRAVVQVLAVLLCGFSAPGYKWPNSESQPVSFRLHPDGSADVTDGSELEAIRRAFNTWEEVSCSYLRYDEEPWVEPRTIANDSVHRIFWVEASGEWPGSRSTLALTYTFYTQDGQNRITDADMIINGVDWVWTTVDAEIGTGTPAKVDVETVVFHEVGHFFGLAHSADPAAAMYASNNKAKQRTPAQDDVNGVCYLYSNGQPVPDITGGGRPGAPVGAACNDGQSCSSSLCVQDPLVGFNYCTQTCMPGQSDACPAGFTCERAGEDAYCLLPPPADELCDLCSSGGQCATGLCVTVPEANNAQPFCSRACDPTPGQPQQCPNGYQCQRVQQGTSLIGACVPNSGLCDPVGKGGQGERCYANNTCKAGHQCVEYYSGLNYCYALCPIQAEGQSCGLPRTSCVALPGVPNTAVCLPIARETEPCVPEVCDNTSFCAWDDPPGIDSALCYRQCPGGGAQCPENYQCQVFEGLPALCVPNAGYKLDGEACSDNAVCESRTCRTFGQNRLCTRACATTDPDACRPGTRCVADGGSTQGLCWPTLFEDPDATDPNRNPTALRPADYCACDTTSSCDADCECDPECAGGSCSCRAAQESGGPTWSLALLLLAGLRARTRLSSGRGRRSGGAAGEAR